MSELPPSPRRGHYLTVNNRSALCITGVLEVISFDPEEIMLDTEEGRMQIRGNNLHIKQLLIEKGELEIEGRPDSILYTDTKKQVNESLLSRIFR